MLFGEDSRGQRFGRVLGGHFDGGLHHDRAVIEMLIDEVHRAAAQPDAGIECLLLDVQAGYEVGDPYWATPPTPPPSDDGSGGPQAPAGEQNVEPSDTTRAEQVAPGQAAQRTETPPPTDLELGTLRDINTRTKRAHEGA